MALTEEVDQRLRAELRRILDEGGPGADDAAIALGDGPTRQRLKSAMRALAEDRAPGGSTCPSDTARAVAQNWRDLMPQAREVAREVANAGDVEITQRGQVLDADGDWPGPVRIRRAAR